MNIWTYGTTTELRVYVSRGNMKEFKPWSLTARGKRDFHFPRTITKMLASFTAFAVSSVIRVKQVTSRKSNRMQLNISGWRRLLPCVIKKNLKEYLLLNCSNEFLCLTIGFTTAYNFCDHFFYTRRLYLMRFYKRSTCSELRLY